MWILYILIPLLTVALLFFLITFICFYRVFYSPKRSPLPEGEYTIPKGKIYEPFREQMIAWQKSNRAFPYEVMQVKSFDGLILSHKGVEHTRF